MSNKKRSNSNDTNVKYAKSEKITLVTGPQVREFHEHTDRDSFKAERTRLFRNNPSPQHHYRYVPETRAFKPKSKRSNFIKINSKNKRLISYCLIYVLLFVCAIVLLYLFYTPKHVNLFGFYRNNNLRLKFYRFVLGTNGTSTTITPKIITTTEPTIFLSSSTSTLSTTSSTSSSTIKSKTFFTSESPATKSSTTIKPNIKKFFDTEITTLPTKTSLDAYKPTEETTLSPIKTEKTSDKQNVADQKVILDKEKTLTTCVTINVTSTSTTEPSIIKKSQSSPSTKLSTASSDLTTKTTTSKPTTKSKIIDTLKKSTTTTMPTTTQAKDNSTELSEFKEKFQYSNTQLSSMDKNETDEETIVDSGVLPTEEELEDERKSQIESRQKIASFFGVDTLTDKKKDENKKSVLDNNQAIIKNRSSNSENDQLNTFLNSNIVSKQQTNNNNNNNKWFLSGNQQFGNRDFAMNRPQKKEDEFKYHPMLKLIYRDCYGGCTS